MQKTKIQFFNTNQEKQEIFGDKEDGHSAAREEKDYTTSPE
jgi:hypothetical protein